MFYLSSSHILPRKCSDVLLLLVGSNLLQSRVEDLDLRQPIYQPGRQALIKNICDIEGGRAGGGGLNYWVYVGGENTNILAEPAGDGWQSVCGGEGGGGEVAPPPVGRGLYDWWQEINQVTLGNCSCVVPPPPPAPTMVQWKLSKPICWY